jgi:hypothetical protein
MRVYPESSDTGLENAERAKRPNQNYSHVMTDD